jgi:hypothetical protein
MAISFKFGRGSGPRAPSRHLFCADAFWIQLFMHKKAKTKYLKGIKLVIFLKLKQIL